MVFFVFSSADVHFWIKVSAGGGTLHPREQTHQDSVDAGPMGFPTEKREEDLVQLGFPTCNPTRISTL